MKEKIIKVLKTMYSNFGLSEKALDGVAAFLEKTIEKEEDISSKCSEETIPALLKVWQSDLDTLRTENSDLKKRLSGNPGNQDIETLKAEMQSLKDSLKESQAKETATRILAGVREKLNASGRNNTYILNNVLNGASVNEGDTAESLEERFNGLYDAGYKEVFGKGFVPPKADTSQKGEDYKEGQFKEFAESLRKEGLLPDNK